MHQTWQTRFSIRHSDRTLKGIFALLLYIGILLTSSSKWYCLILALRTVMSIWFPLKVASRVRATLPQISHCVPHGTTSYTNKSSFWFYFRILTLCSDCWWFGLGNKDCLTPLRLMYTTKLTVTNNITSREIPIRPTVIPIISESEISKKKKKRKQKTATLSHSTV